MSAPATPSIALLAALAAAAGCVRASADEPHRPAPVPGVGAEPGPVTIRGPHRPTPVPGVGAEPGPVTIRGPDVSLRVASELTVAVGEAAALSVTVAPAAGRVVSADGPLRLEVEADDGLVVPRRRYARTDAADPAADEPRFDVRLKGKAAGEHALALAVRLWLCGPKLCRPVRLERTVTIHVTPPPGLDAGLLDAGP